MSRVIECGDTEFFARTMDTTRTFCVDFNATWCRPCREMAPIFHALSNQYPFLTFLSVDIDKAPNTAAKFGIRSVPTFMFLDGTNVIDQVGGMDQDQLEEKCRKYGTPKKGEPRIVDVNCTLDELYTGTNKSVTFTRKRRQKEGLVEEERTIEIAVKAGWKQGTKLTYPGEGDEEGMRLASDVVFVIKEIPHGHYRRAGNDLVYDINVTLPEALEHKTIKAHVPLIEGGVHSFASPSEPTKLITEHRVANRGMPISKSPGSRGDLLINIQILLPQSALTSDQIDRVKAILAA